MLRWINKGGYTFQVGEDGRGIFRRNSVTAQDHNAELVTLVLQVLIKKTWEVAREADLRGNGIFMPMGLAPKPGKTPPWHVINDEHECNEHVIPWAFRYETLKTLGLVLNPGDYMSRFWVEKGAWKQREKCVVCFC